MQSRSSQTRALRRLEFGHDLCNDLTLRAELTNLSHFHELSFPSSSFHTHPTSSPLRNAHIVTIASSSDRCLAAIGSSDGRCEIHEPTSDDDSLRLTLSAQARLSTVAFFPHADILATATSDSPALYAYDLNKCTPDNPTSRLVFRGAQSKPVTDLAPLGWPVCAGVRPGQLALFDLRVPTQSHRRGISTSNSNSLRYSAQMVSAVSIPFSDPVVMASSSPSSVLSFPSVSSSSVTAAAAPSSSSITATDDNVLFVAEGEHVFAYDRRRLPAVSSTAKTSSSLVMGGMTTTTPHGSSASLLRETGGHKPSLSSLSSSSSAHLLKKFGALGVRIVPAAKRVRYNWMSGMEQSAPGVLAFHGTDGTFGVLDWTSGKVETAPEPQQQRSSHSNNSTSNSELVSYGATTMMMGASLRTAWYIRRRRGDIVLGTHGRGWRAVVPNMKSTGLRMIAFGPNFTNFTNMTHFNIPAVQQHDVACVHAVDGQLNKIVVGTTKNEVLAFKVDIDRSIKQAREQRVEDERGNGRSGRDSDDRGGGG